MHLKPCISSSERKASQSLQNLTKLGNPCTHLCTQTKYNEDSEAPCEATGMPGMLEGPQYQALQARGKLGQPTGKAALVFARSWDNFSRYFIYSYQSHRMAT